MNSLLGLIIQIINLYQFILLIYIIATWLLNFNIINSSKIDNIYVYGKNIKHTFKKISSKKRRLILNNKKEIINLIKNDINNNDYLMIKGSNSTGLYKLSDNLKKGNLHAI